MARADRRFYRTLVLGLAALGVMVWTAIDQFNIPLEEMTGLLLATVWIVGAIIGCAALFAVLWIGLRKLLARFKSD